MKVSKGATITLDQTEGMVIMTEEIMLEGETPMRGKQWKDPYLRQDSMHWDRYRERNRRMEGIRWHEVLSWSQKLKNTNF